MYSDKIDFEILDLLPNEVWAIIISYLPRITRHSLAKLHGFYDLIENVSQLEDRKLYHALKNGNKLHWKSVNLSKVIMQPRLKHGAVNCKDELIIFGGASSNQPASGMYNDVWIYNNYTKFRRMTTSSSTCPSPKANFAFVNSGCKIFVVGGRSSVGSVVDQPYSSLLNSFELHAINTTNGIWQKVQVTGNEPQVSNGIRAVMLSKLELLTVSGVIPTFHNWDAMNAEENVQYRTSMQVCILKFTDETLEKGHWHTLADFQNRRGFPVPRTEPHLANLGTDSVLLFGGRAINSSCQDAWIMKISRSPTYSIKFLQVAIENPLVPSLPTHIFPSCLINDVLVFAGVRTSLMKKPEIEKPKNNNSNNNIESQKAAQPSTSGSSSSSSMRQQQAEVKRIFINQERPLNTIGAMAAFSVSMPSVVPQKVLKIQVSPDPPAQPQTPKRLLQDYPMRIFCLDLSNIMNCSDDIAKDKLRIRWLTMKNGGLFPNAPELRAHATFTKLDNCIALIGGVKRSQSEDDDVLFTQATNEVFMLNYNSDET